MTPIEERVVYYINVENLPKARAKEFVEECIAEFKKTFPTIAVLGVAVRNRPTYIEHI